MLNAKRLIPSLVAVSIAVAGITACEAAHEAGGERTAETRMQEKEREQSGIEGVTVIKVSPPVSREGEPEPDARPFQTDLAFLTEGERREVARIKTGSDGRFRVSLPPGEYIIKPLPAPSRRGSPRASDHLVKVSSGQFIFVRVVFESGLQ